MSVSNKHIYDLLSEFRKEVKDDNRIQNAKIDANTAFRNNLSGKIAMGVIAIGAFISVVTAVITSYINNKIFGK